MLRHLSRFAACLLAASSAHAQGSLAVAPIVGYYRPFGHFAPASVLSTALPRTPSDLSGLAWGASLRSVLRPRVAVEVFATTSESTLPGCLCPGGPTPSTRNRVTIASAMLQYEIAPSAARTPFWLSAGPAMIRHGGDGYGRYGAPTDWGGAVGLDAEHAIASQWRLVAGAKGVVYAFDLAFPPEHGTQLDALLSFRLEWHPGS
jgi:hypothetical protein